MILELDALRALDSNQVEPTVFEEGLFDLREIIDAVFRRYRLRILSLRAFAWMADGNCS
jgi:hypothetical protein